MEEYRQLDRATANSAPPTALVEIAVNAHAAVDNALKHLGAVSFLSTERERCMYFWQHAMTGLTWDIAEAAIGLSLTGSARATRGLNRSLFEYALRVHHYLVFPEAAENDVNQGHNALRRVVKPLGQHPKNEDTTLFKALLAEGNTTVTPPKVNEMIRSLVENVGPTHPKKAMIIEHLEAEYALSTAYIHGSQAVFFDLVQQDDIGQVHFYQRSPVLHRKNELLRTITSILSLIVGLEQYYQTNLGFEELRQNLNKTGPWNVQKISLATHNALLSLLGIK